MEQSSLPYPECWIPVKLQAQLKTHLFSTRLDFILSLKKTLYYLFLPLLACTYLNNAWDLVLRALPLSVWLFNMNHYVFPNCMSLWIKASAKWLNVNVNHFWITTFICWIKLLDLKIHKSSQMHFIMKCIECNSHMMFKKLKHILKLMQVPKKAYHDNYFVLGFISCSSTHNAFAPQRAC